ncbi:hypothetical protein KGF57_004297 [Candida theae]|uniref:Nucleolar 27S pre-rRNA processing Urb2/Npa2 C-terminal domain-containing protein n=1 Tax=Candida theae TaxID=1198502 RepID=A0AAD5BBK3_9ASCO|nr:uncharacterized protein KGF57_004297 [Candida theae]KAI5950482.1 hypothetical protein KGF57_004297 [Candida theae]
MPSTTINLRSSEAITKFLRSKNEDVQHILNLAREVLDHKLDAYLPNAGEFILSLLVDRLNDRSNSSSFGKWKYNNDVWNLLEKVLSTKSPSQTDANLLQNLKIIDLTILLLDSDDVQSWNCLPVVCRVLLIFMQQSFLEIDESTGVRLLKATLNFTEKDLYQTISISLDPIVINLYWNSSSQGAFEVSKRTYSQFFEELFYPLTRYLSSGTHTPTKHLYEEVFTKRIFNPDNISYMSQNFGKFLTKHNMDNAVLVFFFQKAVQKLASSNMNLCTELFDVIVETSPELSESLISIMADSQHAIPQDFITSVYAKEVASKKFINLNWDMVKYIFELDSELAASKSKFVFEKYNSAFNLNEKVLPVGKVVVSAYAKNRELVDFLLKVWPKAIAKDELWDGEEFILHVASCVNYLSEKQLVHVIEASPKLSTEACAALLSALTKGMISAPPSLVDSLESRFLQLKDVINTTDNFWEIRYNLLILYGTNFDIPESLLKLDYDMYYHYTIFRLLELNVLSAYSEKQQAQFILFLRDNENITPSVLRRWFIVVNDYFTFDNMTGLLKIGLKMNVLCGIDDEFYEQKNIMNCCVRLFITDPISYSDQIDTVPLSCYARGPKRDLLDTLANAYLSSKDTRALKCIDYLLESASYQSIIERDFSVLLQLWDISSHEEARKYMDSISKKVWKSNIDMIRSEDNRKYVDNAIESLLSGVNNDSDAGVSSYMEITLSVVTLPWKTLAKEYLSKFEKLVLAFKNSCTRHLKKRRGLIKNSTLVWILQGLAGIPRSMINFDDVSVIIKQIGNQVDEDAIKQSLFRLICKTAEPDLRSAKFVLSLYSILNNDVAVPHLHQDVVEYLKTLADSDLEVYQQVCSFVIMSAEIVEKEFVDSTYLVVSALLSTIPRECDEALLTGLFSCYLKVPSHSISLKVMSNVVVNLKWLLTHKSWMFTQYVLEMAIGIVAEMLVTSSNKVQIDVEELFLQSSQTVSQMLLHHRFKLSTRHHLVVNLMCTFLERLIEPALLGHSVAAASAFTRLLSNLCEPQEHVKDASTSSWSDSSNPRLTTQSNIHKKSLRSHMPYFMINYIHLSLKFTFQKQVNDILVVGIYTVFDILSKSELSIVNSALDYAGKALYKSLYRDYQEYWKWKDQ